MAISADLVIPSNITLLALPPYAPELMPMERVWLWRKEHDLSNRVFRTEKEIDDACVESWNGLTPERLQIVAAETWVTELGVLPRLSGSRSHST